jgi:amino acid transporter
MTRGTPSHCGSLLTALTIWFMHFMVCWAASELIWPNQRPANVAAWLATGVGLGALALHARRLRHRRPQAGSAGLAGWTHRVAHGAVVLAAVAVLFGALPSLVLNP